MCTESPIVGENDIWKSELFKKNNYSSANINIEYTEFPIAGEIRRLPRLGEVEGQSFSLENRWLHVTIKLTSHTEQEF